MFVIHAYEVLGVVHVAMYVPAASPRVGAPMEESRLLARSERSTQADSTSENILEALADCFDQLHREGRDITAVLEV